MSTWSIPAVKLALVTAMKGALPEQQVEYGVPGDTLDRSVVFVGNVQGATNIPLIQQGRKPREERYEVDIVFQSLVPGGSIQDAEADLFANVSAVDDYFANDPSAGQIVLQAILQDFVLTSGFEAEASWAQCIWKLHVLNRLT